jgi:hypothetical protein
MLEKILKMNDIGIMLRVHHHAGHGHAMFHFNREDATWT